MRRTVSEPKTFKTVTAPDASPVVERRIAEEPPMIQRREVYRTATPVMERRMPEPVVERRMPTQGDIP